VQAHDGREGGDHEVGQALGEEEGKEGGMT